MDAPPDLDLWERILRAEEANLAYFAARTELPGVSVFTCERPDAPEFDLAVIYRVAEADADVVLQEIVAHFLAQGRTPRVRLTPLSLPGDWPDRVRRAGFVETAERHRFFTVPETARLLPNPDVVVRRAVTPEDADRFSAIQVVGFAIPPEHQAWDRALARRRLAAGHRDFSLASLDGETVGAAACTHLPGGLTGLYGLTTLPSARRRGVAASLLHHQVTDARAAGSTVVFGSAAPGSYAAGLYDRLGFTSHFAVRTFARHG